MKNFVIEYSVNVVNMLILDSLRQDECDRMLNLARSSRLLSQHHLICLMIIPGAVRLAIVSLRVYRIAYHIMS